MTTPRRPGSTTKPVVDRTGQTFTNAGELMFDAGDETEQAIRQALQTLLQSLSVTPDGQVAARALQRLCFEVTVPEPGFAITVEDASSSSSPFTLPVAISVCWDVLDEQGKPLSFGDRFVADPPSLDALSQQLLFFPTIVKVEMDAPSGPTFTLRASVRLIASHPNTCAEIVEPQSGRANLPHATVSVPSALRIPSILAFFRHRGFGPSEGEAGFALVFAPSRSGISSVEDLGEDGALGALMEEAGALRTAIETLSVFHQSLVATLAGNLEGFLDGLSSLMSNLRRFGAHAASSISIRSEESNDNLRWKELTSPLWNGEEGDNELTSLIFLGLDEMVTLYNAEEYRQDRGIVQIETGPKMCAVIERLGSAKPTASIGDPTITMLGAANLPELHTRRSGIFDNTTASFHFGKRPPR